ncbi:hypothetical protein BGW38_006191 [Lunasporangiospora selenospora]|uniref:FAD-binding FR-type domain-containing protein n=1 Tax=Lunasporangiospora selenospora TaxID=979761 RepID=A0A9P6FMJ2_9FUNG|nr:hypothetical protein BGW38_006191 [Lunasporangiospora selenospora]
MSASAVSQWLQEIAAAKAKVAAKSNQLPDQVSSPEASIKTDTTTHSPHSPSTPVRPEYGIISSYDLKTRKPILRLQLPQEPRKPEPGECCGNDCTPCVNTLYWSDLEEHRALVRRLEKEYAEACQRLEREQANPDNQHRESIARPSWIDAADTKMDRSDDGATQLSVRTYRPFKVLEKKYLSTNVLRIVCDLPYTPTLQTRRPIPPSRDTTKAKTDPVDKEQATGASLFHVLIRFKLTEHQYLTRAFTPESGDVLYLRGPIRTLTDEMDQGSIEPKSINKAQSSKVMSPTPDDTTATVGTKARAERLVMIAAGSGITPMYQLLREIHQRDDHHHHTHEGPLTHLEEQLRHDLQREPLNSSPPDESEIDLIYCNRATDEIWLRQEIQSLCSLDGAPDDDPGSTLSSSPSRAAVVKAEESPMTYANLNLDGYNWNKEKSVSGQGPCRCRKRIVRIQHVLSSVQDHHHLQQLQQQHGLLDREEKGKRFRPQERIHAGRITLELLRETLDRPGELFQSSLERVSGLLASPSKVPEESLDLPLKKMADCSLELLRNQQERNELSGGHRQDPETTEPGGLTRILICGPPLFNKDVAQMLEQLGYHERSGYCQIHILE